MAKKVDKSTLGYMGDEFQRWAVKITVTDPVYKDFRKLISMDIFTNNECRAIIQFVLCFYDMNGVYPNYEQIRKYLIDNKFNLEYFDCLDKIESMDADIQTYNKIEKSYFNFLKMHHYTKAVNKASDLIKKSTKLSDCKDVEEILMSAINDTSNNNLIIRKWSVESLLKDVEYARTLAEKKINMLNAEIDYYKSRVGNYIDEVDAYHQAISLFMYANENNMQSKQNAIAKQVRQEARNKE